MDGSYRFSQDSFRLEFVFGLDSKPFQLSIYHTVGKQECNVLKGAFLQGLFGGIGHWAKCKWQPISHFHEDRR